MDRVIKSSKRMEEMNQGRILILRGMLMGMGLVRCLV
jgi:hypothetical protein